MRFVMALKLVKNNVLSGPQPRKRHWDSFVTKFNIKFFCLPNTMCDNRNVHWQSLHLVKKCIIFILLQENPSHKHLKFFSVILSRLVIVSCFFFLNAAR